MSISRQNKSYVMAVVAALLAFLTLLCNFIAITPSTLKSNSNFYLSYVKPYLPLSTLAITLMMLLWSVWTIIKLTKSQTQISENDSQVNGVEAFSNREHPKLKKLFSDAMSNSTYIITISIANNRLVHETSLDFYEQLILRNGTLKAMFLDPTGREIEKRELEEGRGRGSLIHNVINSIENLRKFKDAIQKKYSNVNCELNWCCYDFQPGMNVIVIDKRIAFVQYYSQHDRGADVPAFVITKNDKKIFDFYSNEVERIWSELNQKK